MQADSDDDDPVMRKAATDSDHEPDTPMPQQARSASVISSTPTAPTISVVSAVPSTTSDTPASPTGRSVDVVSAAPPGDKSVVTAPPIASIGSKNTTDDFIINAIANAAGAGFEEFSDDSSDSEDEQEATMGD